MKLLDLDFVLTSDRSMITDHHRKEFVGFMTTSPPIVLPSFMWRWIAAPKPKIDKYGRPLIAPYGMRKVEAALVKAGFKAAVIDPSKLKPYLKRVKAVMIGHHDYFGVNPPSVQWWMLFGKEPLNRVELFKLMNLLKYAKEHINKDLIIVAGGPAAWQWIRFPKLREHFKVDVVLEGEAEEAVVELARKILNGEELPKHIEVKPKDAPENIPTIIRPSVNGLVEISRGCPRGCKFCPVTLRRFRHFPLNMIKEEILVNKKFGIDQVILHAEDVLLYGAHSIIPNPDAVLKLNKMALETVKDVGWSHAALATVVVAEKKFKLMTKLAELFNEYGHDYFGFQTGIETGSPRLASIIMRAKAAPYPPDKWPEVVEEAFGILHDLRIVPASTLIVGVPGEKDEDVVKTIELVERLKPYRSLIIPLLFVPMGLLSNKDWFKSYEMKEVHAELFSICLKHTLKWAPEIAKWYVKDSKNPFFKLGVLAFIKLAQKASEKIDAEVILNSVKKAKEQKKEGIYKEEMFEAAPA